MMKGTQNQLGGRMPETGGAGPGDRAIRLQLAAARELLGMELAYLAEFRGEREVYRVVDGEGRAFGIDEGTSAPITGGEPGGGSYVDVPVQFSDGRLFGRLCCLSRRPNRLLGRRDVRMMEVLARLIGEHLEREQHTAVDQERERRQIEATGVGALLIALDARDSYTGKHTDAVVELALQVARELGLDSGDRREVAQVAMLHDIGKIGVPDAILLKPGPLNDREWDVMRSHPALGARMLVSAVSLAHLAPAVRAEHERWDGGGYPDGLRGDEIPISSRIVFACDAFHAMSSDRPYRNALSRRAAVSELEDGSGTQFCPSTVGALLRSLPDTPVEREAVPAA
jgi:hypothetical protein